METSQDKSPVVERVARRLQQMIRNGELPSGEKIPSQRTLSLRLEVSRPTLREAILTLETLGLVRTLPARGTYVVDPAAETDASPAWRYEQEYSLREVFQSRLLIETELARLAASQMNTAIFARLGDAARLFSDAWAAGDLVSHVKADLAFHRGIAEACPNRILTHLYSSAQDLISESQRQPIPNTEGVRMAQSISEHGEILRALSAGDGQGAAAAMSAHIRNTAFCAGVVLNQ